MNMTQGHDHGVEGSSSAAQFSRVVDKGTLHESDFGASLVGNLEEFFKQNRHRINVRRLERDFDGCVLDGILTPEECDSLGEWELDSLNPTFLFARYKNGGHFSPHTDGTTVFNFNTRTLYTVLVYLNDFEGAENDPCSGATRVYDDAQIWEALQVVESLEDENTKARRRIVGNERHVVDTIVPKKGRVLIFYHRLMHEGLPSRNKYIIRTDLVFKRTPELLTSEVDKEAFAMYQEAEKLAELGKNREAMEKFRWAFGMSPELRRIYKQ
eukprot:g3396.t1